MVLVVVSLSLLIFVSFVRMVVVWWVFVQISMRVFVLVCVVTILIVLFFIVVSFGMINWFVILILEPVYVFLNLLGRYVYVW